MGEEDIGAGEGQEQLSAEQPDPDVAAFDAELAGEDGSGDEPPLADTGSEAEGGGDGTSPGAPPAETPAAPPEPKRYTTPDGRQLTAQELEQEGLLDLAWTHHGQVHAYQKKHEESIARAKELEAELEKHRRPPAPEPEPPRITPDQLLVAMKPEMEQLVKDGWIEEDFVELYPKAAARQAADSRYMRSLLLTGGKKLNERLVALEQVIGKVTEVATVTERERLGQTLISRIVAGGEHFKALEQPEERQAFAEFVVAEGAGNLDPEAVSDRVLQGLYLAFKAKQKPPAAPPAPRKAPDQIRADSAGGNRGPGAPANDVEAWERELIEAGRMVRD